MKKLLLLILVAGSFNLAFAQGCDDLFISEYIEGWSNNKAIELYNPTSSSIDLSGYKLERYSNGSNSAAENQKIELEGTITAYGTYVIVIDQRDPEGEGQDAPVWEELQAAADVFLCPVYEDNNTMYFNGNDGIVLRHIESNDIIDVFGRIGEDPGNPSDGGGWNNVGPDYAWAVNNETAWSTDHTLIRKESVVTGDSDGLNLFDVSLEYDSLPANTFENLGSHTSVCGTDYVADIEVAELSLFPNPSTNGMITIQMDGGITNVRVMDLNGKLVYEERNTLSRSELTLDLTSLPKGSYIVLAENAAGDLTRNQFMLK